jgi:hypothetical protein
MLRLGCLRIFGTLVVAMMARDDALLNESLLSPLRQEVLSAARSFPLSGVGARFEPPNYRVRPIPGRSIARALPKEMIEKPKADIESTRLILCERETHFERDG